MAEKHVLLVKFSWEVVEGFIGSDTHYWDNHTILAYKLKSKVLDGLGIDRKFDNKIRSDLKLDVEEDIFYLRLRSDTHFKYSKTYAEAEWYDDIWFHQLLKEQS